MDYVKHGEQAVGHCIAEAQVAACTRPSQSTMRKRFLSPPTTRDVPFIWLVRYVAKGLSFDFLACPRGGGYERFAAASSGVCAFRRWNFPWRRRLITSCDRMWWRRRWRRSTAATHSFSRDPSHHQRSGSRWPNNLLASAWPSML